MRGDKGTVWDPGRDPTPRLQNPTALQSPQCAKKTIGDCPRNLAVNWQENAQDHSQSSDSSKASGKAARAAPSSITKSAS